MPRKLISTQELLGSKYGRLTIIEDLGKTDYCRRIIAQCECGVIKKYALNELRSGGTKSCGCLLKEMAPTYTKTHGLSKHHLYFIWHNMKCRCYDIKNAGYHNYGGRGIVVYEKWIKDFKSFFDWAIASGWQKGLTIERMNNDGNYEPSNCIWADDLTQAHNKRTNVYYTFNNITKCLKEWCTEFGLSYKVTHQRINRDNWTPEDAILNYPIYKKNNNDKQLAL